jgi:probable addiction module antidote protein
MKNVVSYQTILLKQLKDPAVAAEYLTACYEDGPAVFLEALRNVMEAQGGVRRAARLTKLNRESLYRLCSVRGNPRFSGLAAVLGALRVKVSFSPA